MASRTGLPRPLAIPLALLLGVVLCELLLWGASLFVRGERALDPQPLGPDGRVVVCLGDSNTFGLYEESEDAYPGVLDALLDARAAGGPHRVLNLGIPGLNSRQVLESLPEVLATHEPDLVLVVVGINNAWSWRDESVLRYGRPWYESLRLAKLLRIAGERFDGAGEEPGPEAGEQVGRDRTGRAYTLARGDLTAARSVDGLEAGVGTDLRAMHKRVEESGARLVLLTYGFADGAQRTVNAVLREVAAETGAPLVDGAAALAAAAERIDPELLFYPDSHPTALGYEIYGRHAFNRLLEEGFFDGDPVAIDEDLGADPRAQRAPGRLELVRGEDGAPALRLVGAEPGVRFQVLLSRQGAGRRGTFPGVVTPLVSDALFFRCAGLDALGGTTDGGGAARVPLDRAFRTDELAALAGVTLHGAFLVLEDSDPPRVRAASEAFALAF